jgi:hypothetical protein
MKLQLLPFLLLLSLVLIISGSCKKEEQSDINKNSPGGEGIYPVEEGKSKLHINLAANYSLKALATYNAVNINIQQISYHTSGDSTVSGGWIDLETIPGIYNLMDFVEADTLIAFDSLVASQTISQVRMILGDSNTVMVDSVLYDLATPSAQSSGLKVQVHTQMIPDSSYVIMLDFDPAQ